MMWGYGWFGMGFAWLSIVLGIGLIIAALLVLAWWAQRLFAAPPIRATRDRTSALDTLAQRFAAGELDEATFERMRAQIQGLPAHEPNREVDREPVDAQARRS